MTIRTDFLTLSLLALPVSTVIACDAPSAPIVPDGDSASLEEMVAAQAGIKAFQESNAEYLKCVDEQMATEKNLEDEGDEGAQERYALAAADYNAAVSREEQVAADFNTEIRAYKSANPD